MWRSGVPRRDLRPVGVSEGQMCDRLHWSRRLAASPGVWLMRCRLCLRMRNVCETDAPPPPPITSPDTLLIVVRLQALFRPSKQRVPHWIQTETWRTLDADRFLSAPPFRPEEAGWTPASKVQRLLALEREAGHLWSFKCNESFHGVYLEDNLSRVWYLQPDEEASQEMLLR